MDRSFHQSFAALSGSFDGSLELWDLRKDEPLQGGLGGADRWIMIFGGLIWLIMVDIWLMYVDVVNMIYGGFHKWGYPRIDGL